MSDTKTSNPFRGESLELLLKKKSDYERNIETHSNEDKPVLLMPAMVRHWKFALTQVKEAIAEIENNQQPKANS